MSQKITLEELQDTHAYKVGHLAYPHPHQLITKFINLINQAKCEYSLDIKVDKEGGAKLENNEDIVTWGRGFVIANIYKKNGAPLENNAYIPCIGIAWAYDISHKVIKVFRGVNTKACTNLSIFNTDDLYKKAFGKVGKIKDEVERDRKWERICRDIVEDCLFKMEDFINSIDDNFNYNIEILHNLNQKIFVGDAIYKLIGTLYLETVLQDRFDITTFNEGCRLIFNDAYLHPNKELYRLEYDEGVMVLPLLQLYQALTQRITDGKVELDDIDEKTLEISTMLLPYLN